MRWIALLFALVVSVSAYAQPITQLPAANLPLVGTETIPLVQAGTTKQTTVGNIPNLGGACAISGCTFTGTVTFDAPANLTAGGTITGATITGATITGSPISGSTGAFTTLSASGAATFGTGGSAPITLSSGLLSAASGHGLEFVTGGVGNSLNFGNAGGGFGDVLTVTTNTGGNSNDGSTGNQVTVSNILQSNFYHTNGATYTLSGSQSRSPLFLTTSYAGSSTGSLPAYRFVIPADNIDANAAGGWTAASVTQNLGTSAHGSRITFAALLNVIAGNISGDTTSQQYQPTSSQFQASVNVGGTDTGSGAKGFAYGFYPQVLMRSGATDWALANGWGEGDVGVQSGASVGSIYGGSTVLLGSHAVAGTNENSAWVVAAQQGALNTWTLGYSYGNTNGQWPMAASATMVGTRVEQVCGGQDRSCLIRPQLATFGTDWGSVNFSQQSGYAFRSPGFAVDGAGQSTIASGLAITSISTGYSIDIPNSAAVTSVAVVVSGTAASGLNSYYPGDLLYGAASPTPGQYEVTHTKAIGAAIVAGGSGGTDGSCKVVGTTGTGTKAIFNVTILGGTITAVGSVDTAGDYTVNPTGVGKVNATGALNAEPMVNSSGCGSITGATLNFGMGALTVSTLVGGVFNACPGAGGISPTGGSGNGLTLTPTCTTKAVVSLGTTSATAINIGNSASTTTVAGVATFGQVVSQKIETAPTATVPAVGNLVISPSGDGKAIIFGDGAYGIGSIATMNFKSTGSTLVVNGANSQIQSNSIYTGLAGTFVYSGSQAAIGPQYGLLQSLNLSGSVTSGNIAANRISINTDTAVVPPGTNGTTWFGIGGAYGAVSWVQNTAYTLNQQRASNGNYYNETVASCTSSNSGTGPSGTGSGISDGSCSWNYVGVNGAGSRSALNASINIRSRIGSASDSDRQWAAEVLTTAITSNQGGTAPTSSLSAGFVYAGGDQMWCFAGATDLSGCVGRESDIGVFSGASAAERIGIQVVAFGNNQGTDQDVGYKLSINNGEGGLGTYAAAFKIGWGAAGVWPIDANGAIWQYLPPLGLAARGEIDPPPASAYGIDLSGVNFSSAAFNSPGGFSVSGLGTVSFGSGVLQTNGAVFSVDTPGSIVTGVAVAVGGVGFTVGDHVFDRLGDIFNVTSVGAGIITGLSIITHGGTPGSPPSNPISLLGGTGANATVNLSWTAGTTLNLGTTSATAINIGNSGSNTTLAGTLTLATSTTGAATQTFTNSPCSGLTSERWVPVAITGQTGTWYVPACQ